MRLPLATRRTDQNIVRDDADALAARYGGGAYEEARTRAREERLKKFIDGNRPRGHWDKVRREIARRTGKEIGLDTATRRPN